MAVPGLIGAVRAFASEYVHISAFFSIFSELVG